MAETTELRVVDFGGSVMLTDVSLVDGQSRSYSDEGVLYAPSYDALMRLVSNAVLALQRPVLSDATDFPEQDRADLSAMFGRDEVVTRRPRKGLPNKD